MKIKLSLAVLSLSLLSACSSTPVEQAKPAVVIPSAATTQILATAMSNAMNGRKVLLHKNAFTQSNTHNLQHRPAVAPNGHLIDGRMLGMPKPNRFSLFIQGDTCYLVHEKTNKRYDLPGVSCNAL